MINAPSMSSQSLSEDLPTARLSLERPSLDRLPPELLQSILSKLDSTSSLKCAILTSRKLWEAGTNNQVISNVLLQQLDDDDVRHQAIATWRIQHSPRHRKYHTRAALSARERGNTLDPEQIQCDSLKHLNHTLKP